ncbi:GntR family transcriptional regulator [Polaromonas sp.]|uniref:GntR family transcriptional regulator n=1 Tax=Polaromonas sp. TaxID=1869339 RepID=UPI003BAD9CA1
MHSPMGAQEAQSLLASFANPAKVTWTLSEQIANKIAEDIFRGVYEPGQSLLETNLAESFGVSRGPIRDALHVLQVEGLVVIQPRRGASVAVLTPTNIKEIFSLRAVLYGFAAGEAARERSENVLPLLEEGTTALRFAVETAGADMFLGLLYRLSMELLGASSNHYTRNILAPLARLTLSVTRRVMLEEENRRKWLNNWESVVGAIREGNVVAADEAAKRLVLTVYGSVAKLVGTPSDETTLQEK